MNKNTKTKQEPQATSPQALSELIKTIRGVATRLRSIANRAASGKVQVCFTKSLMTELEEAIDVLNMNHSRLIDSCVDDTIVKVDGLEMQEEHYKRYMKLRKV